MFTNTFKEMNKDEKLKGRIEEKEFRRVVVGEFTVIQSKIVIKDSGRTLRYTLKVISKEKEVEFPSTAYAFNIQWLDAIEYVYDKTPIPSG